MKTMWKWLLRILGSLAGLAVVLVAFVYIRSELIIGKTYDHVARDIPIPADASSLAHGEKVARTRGCVGCHTRDGGGQYFVDDPLLATVPAPNLTKLVRERSVAELDRGIRQGVREDGRSVVIMPSGMFQYLTDEDFASAIAYLRSLPEVDRDHGERRMGPIARFAFAMGEFVVERQQFDQYDPVFPQPDDPVRHGEYLATTTCAECHGADLHGWSLADAPDLVVAAAYSPENFIRLMREGIPQGDKALGLMAEVAVGRFAHYSDEELAAIHAYLSSPGFLASATAP